MTSLVSFSPTITNHEVLEDGLAKGDPTADVKLR